jgi:hypothetical protein
MRNPAINLIVDPALNVNNPNNTTHTAGNTFMGQFMDHDMTFDQTSALGEETDPEDSPENRGLYTAKLSPAGWARQAVDAYHEFNADRLIAERYFSYEASATPVRPGTS